jgi:hypothetical protein
MEGLFHNRAVLCELCTQYGLPRPQFGVRTSDLLNTVYPIHQMQTLSRKEIRSGYFRVEMGGGEVWRVEAACLDITEQFMLAWVEYTFS